MNWFFATFFLYYNYFIIQYIFKLVNPSNKSRISGVVFKQIDGVYFVFCGPLESAPSATRNIYRRAASTSGSVVNYGPQITYP
jgi:hypothetical protein